jgi:hypothetical protein
VSERNLRDLFQEALENEPQQHPTIDEDVARGQRFRRRRRTQRGLGAGAITAVAVGATVLLPASPLALHDSETDVVDVATGSTGDAEVTVDSTIADDPVRMAMWRAVDSALPDDVGQELGDAAMIPNIQTFPPDALEVGMRLSRSDGWFELSISLEPHRPQLERFRPCSSVDDNPILGGDVDGQRWNPDYNCQEGDDDGRWRVVAYETSGTSNGDGPEPTDVIMVLENDHASVTVNWSQPAMMLGHEMCTAPCTADTLTEDEAIAVAAAVLDAAEGFSQTELDRGVDLAAATQQWPGISARFEASGDLGELRLVDGSVEAQISPDGTAGRIVATYEDDSGSQLHLVLLQRPRIYGLYCQDTDLPLPPKWAGDTAGTICSGYGWANGFESGARAGITTRFSEEDEEALEQLPHSNVFYEFAQALPLASDSAPPD